MVTNSIYTLSKRIFKRAYHTWRFYIDWNQWCHSFSHTLHILFLKQLKDQVSVLNFQVRYKGKCNYESLLMSFVCRKNWIQYRVWRTNWLNKWEWSRIEEKKKGFTSKSNKKVECKSFDSFHMNSFIKRYIRTFWCALSSLFSKQRHQKCAVHISNWRSFWSNFHLCRKSTYLMTFYSFYWNSHMHCYLSTFHLLHFITNALQFNLREYSEDVKIFLMIAICWYAKSIKEKWYVSLLKISHLVGFGCEIVNSFYIFLLLFSNSLHTYLHCQLREIVALNLEMAQILLWE